MWHSSEGSDYKQIEEADKSAYERWKAFLDRANIPRNSISTEDSTPKSSSPELLDPEQRADRDQLFPHKVDNTDPWASSSSAPP
jgi:hypothetical protein